jgi:hypothetical protein
MGLSTLRSDTTAQTRFAPLTHPSPPHEDAGGEGTEDV